MLLLCRLRYGNKLSFLRLWLILRSAVSFISWQVCKNKITIKEWEEISRLRSAIPSIILLWYRRDGVLENAGGVLTFIWASRTACFSVRPLIFFLEQKLYLTEFFLKYLLSKQSWLLVSTDQKWSIGTRHQHFFYSFTLMD